MVARKKAVNAGTRKEKKKTKAQVLAERRLVRTNMGSIRDVMRLPEVPGFVFRWVNDELKMGVSRIQKLKDIGWLVWDKHPVDVAPPNNVREANISLGSGATVAVGTTAQGESLKAVLMYIDADIYAVDQSLKAEAIDEKEKEMLSQGQGDPGMYGGIRIGQ